MSVTDDRRPEIPPQVETWLRELEWTHDAGVSACHYPGGDEPCAADDHYHTDRGEVRMLLTRLGADLTRLREDQADWRKGVALIASSLGDPADNLSCVRIAELGLQLRARLEEAEAEVARLRNENTALKKIDQQRSIELMRLRGATSRPGGDLTTRLEAFHRNSCDALFSAVNGESQRCSCGLSLLLQNVRGLQGDYDYSRSELARLRDQVAADQASTQANGESAEKWERRCKEADGELALLRESLEDAIVELRRRSERIAAAEAELATLRERASTLEDAAFHFQTCTTCKQRGDDACESGRVFAAFLCGEPLP